MKSWHRNAVHLHGRHGRHRLPGCDHTADPQRSTSPQLAQHVIGYTREGSGVAGLESAYDAILHSVDSQWSVTFR